MVETEHKPLDIIILKNLTATLLHLQRMCLHLQCLMSQLDAGLTAKYNS